MLAWLLFLAGVCAVGASILGGALSPVVLLDLISLWPLAALALLVSGVALLRHASPALVPLSLLSVVVFGVGIYLSQWLPLPSSTADIVAVGVAPATGRIEADLPAGALSVRASDRVVYAVRPLRSGGAAPAPAVLESQPGSSLHISTLARAEDRWFRFRGWRIDLSSATSWELFVSSPELDLDLDGLSVSKATVAGGGVIRMGVNQVTEIELAGVFELVVWPGSVITVFGTVDTPPDWVPIDGGFRSPTIGDGWTVTVAEGGSVKVTSE